MSAEYGVCVLCVCVCVCVVFQAEDGIRDLVRSRGLGDVYKRQGLALGQGKGQCSRLCGENLAGVARVLRVERRHFLRGEVAHRLSLIHI